ncbi:hypothetical protein [Sphingobacterium paucimobilis]|uniref:Uncharacterized protein n=1 Tax=Sphingobacterium paucimobilis HER1398 TaxID=1346330 RepID=U2HWI1_9SPHI|nr:hypothetical protein [Sphingobacterium paucimobilis]ERJ59620.1 hypothetical protein M472_12640 [Sphingobacterium paucimobilis HER1398]
MEKIAIGRNSYAGVMYSSDFVYWYTYLKRRIAKGWSSEELSFLLGKAPFYYNDFELMHVVGKFLQNERIMLDRIYQDSTVEPIMPSRKSYETNEERLIRVNIEEGEFYREFELIVPWTFLREERYKEDGVSKCKKYRLPELRFKEWFLEESLEMVSDATIDIRNKLNRFLDNRGLKDGKMAMELFREVEFTGRHNFKIYPRHLKNGLYNLIKAGKVYVRNMNQRYVFFEA